MAALFTTAVLHSLALLNPRKRLLQLRAILAVLIQVRCAVFTQVLHLLSL